MSRDAEYLRHILESTGYVLQWMEGITLEEFVTDEKLVSAVIRKLEIIGEASTKVRMSSRHPIVKFPGVP